MKQPWAIAAILGLAAGSAAAQTASTSSLVIFGVVDQGVIKGNGGTASNNGGNGTFKGWKVGQAAASRLGFRGTEDLGAGWSAFFELQHRFSPDDGVASTPYWGARSFVRLNSPYGSVYTGRDYSPEYFTASNTDPFTHDGVGKLIDMQYTHLFGQVNGSFDPSRSSIRLNNLVGYITPVFAGLQARVVASAGEGGQNANDPGHTTGTFIEYNRGALYSALGYTRIGKTAGPIAGPFQDNSLLNLGLNYDFGVTKLMTYAARSKTNFGNSTNNAFSVGARTPLGAGVLKTAYARLNPAGDNNTIQKLAVGYDYFFSKRTDVYVDVSQGREDTKTNNSAYSAGIKHVF